MFTCKFMCTQSGDEGYVLRDYSNVYILVLNIQMLIFI